MPADRGEAAGHGVPEHPPAVLRPGRSRWVGAEPRRRRRARRAGAASRGRAGGWRRCRWGTRRGRRAATRRPARASSMATVAPAHRAPTTIASYCASASLLPMSSLTSVGVWNHRADGPWKGVEDAWASHHGDPAARASAVGGPDAGVHLAGLRAIDPPPRAGHPAARRAAPRTPGHRPRATAADGCRRPRRRGPRRRRRRRRRRGRPRRPPGPARPDRRARASPRRRPGSRRTGAGAPRPRPAARRRAAGPGRPGHPSSVGSCGSLAAEGQRRSSAASAPPRSPRATLADASHRRFSAASCRSPAASSAATAAAHDAAASSHGPSR